MRYCSWFKFSIDIYRYNRHNLGGRIMATTTERPLDDALTAIKTRRSVKEYLPTEIPREWIEELLDAAHLGPNHKLTHPWRFHVFSGEGRERLVGARQAAVRWAAEKKG